MLGSKSDEQLIQDTAVFLASLSGAILSPERPILPHQVTPSVEQTQTANEVMCVCSYVHVHVHAYGSKQCR